IVTGRRLKVQSLVAGILFSALTLIAWTQLWFTVSVNETTTSTLAIAVTGDLAAPALSAFSLAGLALVAALTISGTVLRIVLGILQFAIGAGVVASTAAALANPVAASASAVTKVTGVSGSRSVAALVETSSQTAWPWLALIFGALTAAVGIVIAITGRRWPGSSRRYQAIADTDQENSSNPVSDWDRLSGGSDPTSR
ncbi:MAG: hypothetical protein QOE21_614, partial [Microbacteriaceae bacterium]|nr:hypothetical protein [Microbacteriaceae bacterium]